MALPVLAAVLGLLIDTVAGASSAPSATVTGIRTVSARTGGVQMGGAQNVVIVRPAAGSAAERQRDLDRQLDALRETLEGSAKSLVDAAVSLRRAQVKLVAAKAQVATAQSARELAQARDDALAGRLALAQAAVGKARRDLQTGQQQESDTRDRLGSIVRETYVSSGLSALSIALSAQSPAQFADRVSAAGTALRQQNGALARLGVQQAEIRARQSRLIATSAEAAELKARSEVLLGQREAAEQAATAAGAVVSDLVAVSRRALKTIAARTAAEKKRIAALQRQENALSRLLRRRDRARRHGSAPASSNGSGRLSYPVRAPITSGFGMRFHPILHIWRLHAGTDFGAPCGTPVHAAAPGRIVRAGWAGGFGNQVVIDNGMMRGKNIATSYNHLSRLVKRSGPVSRGQLIAYSGTTGLSTGCHLHFEVYVNGTPVNPMGWL